MPSEVHSSAGPQFRGARRAWLVPAGTFLAGCVLGGVVVGAVAGDDADPPAVVAEAARGGGVDGPDEAQAPGDTGLYVRVPDSCVQAADDATALVEQVDRIVAAVGELEPERLRQTVDDAQQFRDEVQDVAAQCREAAAQRLQDAEAAEAASASPAP